MKASRNEAAQWIKSKAIECGFESCGITKAGPLESEAVRLDNWLKKGYHGRMNWMENHFEKRVDPSLLVPGAKSVLSLSFNYYPNKDLAASSNYKLSKYAYGEDYHWVVKRKLKDLMSAIQNKFGEITGRAFVDSAPVLERALAAKSGLGWIGKHSLLLSKQKGSFFFLAELIIDMELSEDQPVTDHCGSCTACIDACPTDAIISERIVDSNKCISYLTIELKEEIPKSFQSSMEGWIFGCDICQDVCPWNRFAKPHSEPSFTANKMLAKLHKEDWTELTEEVFGRLFKKSAVKRAGYIKLKKTIDYCKDDGATK